MFILTFRKLRNIFFYIVGRFECVFSILVINLDVSNDFCKICSNFIRELNLDKYGKIFLSVSKRKPKVCKIPKP